MLGFDHTDEDLLKVIANIYAALLARGIRGTYVHICDPELRKCLANAFPEANADTNLRSQGRQQECRDGRWVVRHAGFTTPELYPFRNLEDRPTREQLAF